MTQRLFGFAMPLTCLLLIGCGSFETEYGDTKGRRGRTSINGLGAFRSLIENAGASTHDVQRLSERTGRNDAIVWIPKSLGPIENDASDWLNDWLGEGNHVLVYVLPDSGSEVDYWSQTRSLAPPTQRLEYRRREADAINQRMTWRLQRRSPPSNGWIQVEARPQASRVQNLTGPWSDAVGSQSTGSDSQHDLSIEYGVRAYDKSANDAVLNKTQYFYPNMPTGPSSSSQAYWNSPNEVTPNFDAITTSGLLMSDTGDIVIGEVTSKDWPQSKVLVVAGGSLLTNFGLTHTTNRAIANRLASDLVATIEVDVPDVAMLVTDRSSAVVREATNAPPTASGMELLSVWPISLITIHFAILGLLSCLVLLPIFGRPRSLRRRSQNNFADHLDAVAALLTRTGDRAFAQSRVDEYLRTVRGESTRAASQTPDAHADVVAAPMPSSNPSPKIDTSPSID